MWLLGAVAAFFAHTAPARALPSCPAGFVPSAETCCEPGSEFVPALGRCAPYVPERLCAAGRLDACLSAGRRLSGRGAEYAGYAAELYRFACEQGAAAGCTALAGLYLRGEGLPRDEGRASQLFDLGCLRGDSEACVVIGERMYKRGEAGATELFAQACHRGNARGCSRYADSLTAGGEISALAAGYYLVACEAGIGRACLSLLQAEREHTTVSAERERSLLERSCRAQDAEGCTLLGEAYLEGLIAPQSSVMAAQSFRTACDAGQLDACGRLASLLEHGDGVRRDLARARELYALACGAGDRRACERALHIPSRAPRQ